MTATVADRIQKQLDDIATNHRRTWREMARKLAVDDVSPRPRDVLEVAAALDIRDPGDQLERDAQAFRTMRQYEAAVELCKDDLAKKLEPFGTMENARMMAEQAQAEADRIKAVVADLDYGCSLSYWTVQQHHLRRENPHLFNEENAT